MSEIPGIPPYEQIPSQEAAPPVPQELPAPESPVPAPANVPEEPAPVPVEAPPVEPATHDETQSAPLPAADLTALTAFLGVADPTEAGLHGMASPLVTARTDRA